MSEQPFVKGFYPQGTRVRVTGGAWTGWLGELTAFTQLGATAGTYAVRLGNDVVVEVGDGEFVPVEWEEITGLDLLRVAPTILRTCGWHRGWYFDRSQFKAGVPLTECRVCALGAMSAAYGGSPTGTNDGVQIEHGYAVMQDAVDALSAVILHLGYELVSEWNDAAADVEAVIGAFEAAANQLAEATA